MTTWKFLDSQRLSVFRVRSDGAIESTLPEYLPPGTEILEPEPADAPPPAGPRTCTPLEFIERFTEAEQLAVVTAAMQVPALRLWYDKLMAAQQVVEDDPRLAMGIDALVSAGLITEQRRKEVLSWG